jgi:hypothetical protein
VNAHQAQRDLELQISARVADDIHSFNGAGGVDKIGIVGISPYSAYSVNPIQQFPVIEALLQRHMAWDWMWGNLSFHQNVFLKDFSQYTQVDTTLLTDDKEIVSNSVYSLYLIPDAFIVKFK